MKFMYKTHTAPRSLVQETFRFAFLQMGKLLFTFLLSLLAPYGVNCHGYLLNPTSRSSIWRLPEFQLYSPPTNYDDNALSCGGIHQTGDPGEDCGVCGDPLMEKVPRDNEIRGKYYRGIITGNYTEGQIINVQVNLTMAHNGSMSFRLCTNPATETQACFNRNLLVLAGWFRKLNETHVPVMGEGIYSVDLQLPQKIKCNHCILQWNYRAGNNWGKCSEGGTEYAEGCGPQTTFRGCADVAIH